MENYAKFVATEILNQLGGNRFIAMTAQRTLPVLMKMVSVVFAFVCLQIILQ